MRILFDTKSIQNTQEENTAITPKSGETKAAVASGMSVCGVQFSSALSQGEAYQERGKSISEKISTSGMKDGEVEAMYMAVMSNSMSEDDFHKMVQNGYDPAKTDVETSVTILDTIKIAVAKSGTQVVGFTDDVSKEKIEKIVGNEAYAQAISEAESLKKLDESQITYMVSNGLNPTIQNLYKAQFSAGENESVSQGSSYFTEETQGYYARKADEVDLTQIAGQVDQIISESGLEVSEENRELAGKILAKGLPLTAENLLRASQLESMTLPMPKEQILQSIYAAAQDGKSPLDADLTVKKSVYDQAVSLQSETMAIQKAAVEQVIGSGQNLNLKKLKESQKSLEAALTENMQAGSIAATVQPQTAQNAEKLLLAQKQLVQVQLQMTVEANVKLLKSNYQIDTVPLQELADKLQTAQQDWQSQDVARAEEISKQASGLATLPAAVLGLVNGRQIDFTIAEVAKSGQLLKAQYEKANQKYEVLMTSPRKDLGDSIQTAFQNVDDILEDMQIDPTQENERAVRILGYNRMTITQENMLQVLSADQAVQTVIRKLTPGATLQMIRDGINPLTTDMTELSDYLENQSTEFSNETEKYSTFLVQLEQKKEITDQEQEAYIGVYRLLRQLEKTDGAAIGYLVQTGADVNLGNLLSAVRTEKHKKVDYKVDDDFGGMEAVTKQASISDQINLINQIKSARDAWDSISADGLANTEISKDTTLKELAAKLTETAGNQTAYETENQTVYETENQAVYEAGNRQAEQITRDYQQIKEVLQNDTEFVSLLKNYAQPVSVDHLLSAGYFAQNRGDLSKKLQNYAEQSGQTDDFEQAVKELQDSFSSKETVQDVYDDFADKMVDFMEQAENQDAVTSLDVKAMQTVYKQLTFATQMAKEENYEVPVKINDTYTAINLKIVHESGQSSVFAETQTDDKGNMTARFDFQTDSTLSAVMTAESDETATYLEEMGSKLQEALTASGFTTGQISVVKVKKSQQTEKTSSVKKGKTGRGSAVLTQEESQENEENKISSVQLYQVAKIFLETIRQ